MDGRQRRKVRKKEGRRNPRETGIQERSTEKRREGRKECR